MMEGVVFSVVLLLVGITLFVAIHIFIIGRLFETGYGSSISDSSPAQRITDSTPKMSSEDLSRLPCFDHVEGGKGGITITNADCAVCLECFKNREKCKSLPDCGHCFHAQCIDSWLLKTPICPICRAAIKFAEISKEYLVQGNDPIIVIANS